MSEKVYALCDVNSFYVSCERLFRPDLAQKPVVVLSNNDGCIISMCDRSKALGVTMAAPFHEARRLIKRHNIQCFSSNYGLYGDISQRFNSILEQHCDHVARYSVDESFLMFDGFEIDLVQHCKKIISELKRSLSLPVCIGIAPTKTLAKVANHYAKKHKISTQGIVDLRSPTQREWVLKNVPIRKIWGIGSKLSVKLTTYGIHTAWDLHNSDPKTLQRIFSVNLSRMVRELRGQACLEFDEQPPAKKSILNSRSFGKPITQYHDLKEALAYHTTRVCEKLRKQHSLATSINLFVYSKANNSQIKSQYQIYSTTLELVSATDDTGVFLQTIELGLKRLYRNDQNYKKAGVMLNGIIDSKHHQKDLFNQLPQRVELMQTFDQINSRFGKDHVKFGSLGFAKNWAMRANSRSPHYTSRWQDIIQLN